MSKRRRARRSLSAGTVVMLTLTAVVLLGFCALLPKLNGNVDIAINAAELAVAIDKSISQIASSVVAVPSEDDNEPLSRAQDAPGGEAAQAERPPAQTVAAAPATQPPALGFTLRMAGRVNLNLNMQKTFKQDDGYRFDWLFDQLGGALTADLTVAALADSVMPDAKMSDANAPVELPEAMLAAGIDAAFVGYPGLLDSGADGLRATLESVREAGLTPFGAYADAAERQRPAIVDAGGVKVALLGLQAELSGNGKKRASEEERQTMLVPAELEAARERIEAARQAGAQVVLVSVCWGKAGAANPTDAQRELAQGLADAGADVILGFNPDAVQEVELLTGNRGDGAYHPTLCAYSLGNLATYDRDKRANIAGLVLEARVEYDPVTGLVAFDELGYTPLYNWRGKEDGGTRYRVLVSNAAAPAFVDDDQLAKMERSLSLVRDVMTGSPFKER